jgi:hypothetical protein
MTRPPGGGMRVLFAAEPPGTAMLIAVPERDAAVRDRRGEAVAPSARVLERARAGDDPGAAEHGVDGELARHVEVLGGRLEVIADFGEDRIQLA